MATGASTHLFSAYNAISPDFRHHSDLHYGLSGIEIVWTVTQHMEWAELDPHPTLH